MRGFGSCLVSIAGKLERLREQIVRLRISRFDRKRTPEKIDGTRGLVLVQREDTEIIQRAFVFAVNSESRLVEISRGYGIALRETKVAECQIGFGVVRHEIVGALEIMLCCEQTICFQSEAAGIVCIECPQRWIVPRDGDK